MDIRRLGHSKKPNLEEDGDARMLAKSWMPSSGKAAMVSNT